jgi:hypothetical protein
MIYYNHDSGVACGDFERPYVDQGTVWYGTSCYSSRTRTGLSMSLIVHVLICRALSKELSIACVAFVTWAPVV